jgi:hypothetical protein
MGRSCSICSHPQRQAIDRELAAGGVLSKISTKFHVIHESLRRHRDSHLPARVIQAQEAEDVKQALDVVQQLRAINGATLQILSEARAVGDGSLALKAIDRLQRQIELQARLLGELDDRPQVNILVSPEWGLVRQALVGALVPYPDARVAVAGALSALEAPA